MKRDMINIGLQRYGTRMLQTGDTFEANRRDARVLHAIKKARYAEGDEAASPEAETPDDIEELRAKYLTVLGKRPFHGWDAATLREKIAAAGNGDA